MKVLAGAIVFPWQQRGRIARAIAIPAAAYIAINAALFLELDSSVAFLVGLVGIILQTYVAITIHRLILLGDAAVPEWGLYSWTKRETLFLGHVFLVAACSLPAVALGFVPFVGIGLALCGIAWILLRLSLVFPAIAIDEWVSIRDSWDLTSDHQLLMLMTVIVFPFLLSLPIMFIALLPWSWLLEAVLDIVLTVLVVAALSLSYREIKRTDHEPEQDDQPV